MRMTKRRFASLIAGTLLATQTLAPIALAATPDAPGSTTPWLVPNEAFQNACTRDRQEEARAEAEGRPVEDVEAVSTPSWRSAFSGYSRYGPVQPRYCWFSSQAPDETVGTER